MWRDVYLESKVLSADPVELIQMLYQSALDSVGEARTHLAKGDIAQRSAAISKVARILLELTASLNHEAGQEISRNLAELYQYMQLRLLDANLKQSDEPLAETQQLLTTLLGAWEGVRRQAGPQVNSSEGKLGDRPAPGQNWSHSETSSPWLAGVGQELAPSHDGGGWNL
jgi:flagellar secretion chaperone FliS